MKFLTSPELRDLEIRREQDPRNGLQQWFAALSLVSSKPADVLLMGDSLTEGYFASSDDTRWVAHFRRALQARFNPSTVRGGEGYIAATHAADPSTTSNGFAALPNRWTLNNVIAGDAWNAGAGIGLGRRYVRMDSSTDYAEISVICDRAWVLIAEGPTGRMTEVLVDGSVVDTRDTYKASIGAYRYDTGALTRGVHTIRVRPLASGTGSAGGAGYGTYVEGVMVFDGDGGSAADAGAGVRIWEAGHYGHQASYYQGPVGTATGYWMNTASGSVKPDLVMIEYGANEANGSVSVATYEAAMGSLVDFIRATLTTPIPSICIWMPGGIYPVSVATWETYRAAAERVAYAKGCAFLDLSQTIPLPVASSASDFYADSAHLKDGSSKVIADLLVNFLTGSPPPPQKAFATVDHGAVASQARPDATVVWWVGSVEPTNAINGDHWTDTS